MKKQAEKITRQAAPVSEDGSWMRQYDIACITAFRDEFKDSTPRTLDDRPQELTDLDTTLDKVFGNANPADKTPYRYSRKENELRNRNIKAALLRLGYGVADISGNRIGNRVTIDGFRLAENSLFVVNLGNDSNFAQHLFDLAEYYNQDSFLFKPKGSDEAYLVGTSRANFPGYGNEHNLGVLHVDVAGEFLPLPGNTSSHCGTIGLKEALGLKEYYDYSRGARICINAIYERTKNRIAEMKKVSN